MAAFPIATTKDGFVCFGFPDVCLTPSAPSPVPIPYPNLGQLKDAKNTSDGSQGPGQVTVGGKFVILDSSEIETTTGDEPAQDSGGVPSGTKGGKVTFPNGSSTVQIHGRKVVRMLDQTEQNEGNVRGTVLGGVPNVLVGG